MIIDFGDGMLWKKALASSGEQGGCVCVGRRADGMIGIRDSKAGSAGVPQWYTPEEWSAFLIGARSGDFDEI